jgi:hypothetical protein
MGNRKEGRVGERRWLERNGERDGMERGDNEWMKHWFGKGLLR